MPGTLVLYQFECDPRYATLKSHYWKYVCLNVYSNASLLTSSILISVFSSLAGPVNIAQNTGLLDINMYLWAEMNVCKKCTRYFLDKDLVVERFEGPSPWPSHLGSEPSLSVKRSVTIDTMLNFDGDGTCKQTFMILLCSGSDES